VIPRKVSSRSRCNFGTNLNQFSKNELEQLKFSRRLFLRTISLPNRPVVLYLDDVQWIDDLTLEVLRSTLLLDNELKHFVFVASFRYNEVFVPEQESEEGVASSSHRPQHKVAQLIEDLKGGPRGAEIQEMTIGSLTADNIHGMLEDILRTDQGVQELSELIVERTGGNAFHIVELLEYLETRRLLEYSLTDFRWKWDLERIRSETTVTSNVAEILKAKIGFLNDKEREVLKQCACLGFRFRESALEVAIAAAAAIVQECDEDCSDSGKKQEEDVLGTTSLLVSYRDVMLRERLLERVGDGQLKFTHDKVHQAALDLFSNELERSQLNWNLGMELLTRYFSDTDPNNREGNRRENLLFLCVDRLNAGIDALRKADDSPPLQFKLCQLNFKAAKRAAELAAFEYSLFYSRKAIEMLKILNKDYWSEHYVLSLELHVLYARMCFCLGGECDEEIMPTINLIAEKAKQIEDCFDAWTTLIEFMSSRVKLVEMRAAIMEIFGKIGEPFDWKPTRTMVLDEMDKLATRLSKISDEQILNLPIAIEKHPMKDFCMRILHSINGLSIYAHGSLVQAMCAFRMVELTLDYGLGDFSAGAFANLANAVVLEFFVTDLGTRSAQLAIKLLDKLRPRTNASEARDMVMIAGVLYSWHKPISLSVDYLLQAYRIAMRNGFVSVAFHIVSFYSFSYFYTGLSLRPFMLDLRKFIQEMHAYGEKMGILLSLSVYQAVLNLTGTLDMDESIPAADSIFDVGGGASKAWRERLNWDGNTGGPSDMSYKLQIAIFCRNFALAVEIKEKLLVSATNYKMSVIVGAYYLGLARACYFGIITYWQVKKSSKLNLAKRQRLLKEAKKYHDMVREWVQKQGNINLPQKLFLLDAEELSLTLGNKSGSSKRDGAKTQQLKAAYEKAIVASVKSGFVQDAAMAAHLASEAIPEEREYYWDRARGFYLTWGASAVVEYIESKNGSEPSSGTGSGPMDLVEPQEGSGFRARTRFAEVAVRRGRNPSSSGHDSSLASSTSLENN